MVAPRSPKDSEKKGQSTGPGGGSLNAPARTAPSNATSSSSSSRTASSYGGGGRDRSVGSQKSSNAAPSGSQFGPRVKSTPVSTAPSSMARESTTDYLSRSTAKKTQDRVTPVSQKPMTGPSVGPTESPVSRPVNQKTSLNAMKGSPAQAYRGIPEAIGQERLRITGTIPSAYDTRQMQGPQRPPRASVADTVSNYRAERSARGMSNPTQRPYDVNNQGMGQVKTTVQIGGSANYGNKLANSPMRKSPETTKNVEASSKAMRNPTQRAYDQYNPNYTGAGAPLKPGVKPVAPVPKPKPVVAQGNTVPVPKPKPSVTPVAGKTKTKPVTGKSKTRVAFEKEFAAARASGKSTFKFRGKTYSTRVK